MPPPERYNTGYNVGVGGAVVQDGRLLLVRRASRRGRGNWQVPGGFVEQNETMELAVVREVEEEAGVTAQVEGVLGIRNRYDEDVQGLHGTLEGIVESCWLGGAKGPVAHLGNAIEGPLRGHVFVKNPGL